MADLTTDSVIQIVQAVIKGNKSIALPVAPPLILAGGFQRAGLSAREMAKEVIIRQQEAGAPIGALPDGGESVTEKMERIRMEVIVRHLLENARLSIVIPSGIAVTTSGVCAVGPVVTQGATVSFGIGTGIIQ